MQAALLWVRLGKKLPSLRLREIGISAGRTLLAAGAGVAMLPTYLAAPLLQRGELVRLFDDFEPQVVGMYAVYASRKHMPATLRTMLDFLAARFTEVPAWDVPLPPR